MPLLPILQHDPWKDRLGFPYLESGREQAPVEAVEGAGCNIPGPELAEDFCRCGGKKGREQDGEVSAGFAEMGQDCGYPVALGFILA